MKKSGLRKLFFALVATASLTSYLFLNFCAIPQSNLADKEKALLRMEPKEENMTQTQFWDDTVTPLPKLEKMETG